MCKFDFSQNCMKTVANILLIIGLLGCGQQKSKNSIIKTQDTVIQTKSNIEREIKILGLPIGFSLDTLHNFDKSRNLETFVSVPISGITDVDNKVKSEIENQKNDFIGSLDKMIKEDKRILTTVNSDFHTEPISVYKGERIVSYLFIVSYYHGGAAHPMTMYYSFNFDLQTKKAVAFDDYFDVKTKADTTYFIDNITKAINREGIYVSKLNDIDFNIENDTISFNFDDYEIASYAKGILQGRINKNKLNDRIKTTYR
jgi:hypothetical protein